MNILRKITTTTLVVLFVASIAVIGGCTKYASTDDLQRLEETRRSASSAERELEQVRGERRQLEQERDAKKSELATAQEELRNVRK